MLIQENNFKVKFKQNCYGYLNILLYKKDNVYIFSNGVCIREDGTTSMEYTSFNNFMEFNGEWKEYFVNVTDTVN